MRTAYPLGCAVSLFLLLTPAPDLYSQSIEWQQVLGGTHSEYLYDVKATPDYGFLLAGSSFSGKTGTKTSTAARAMPMTMKLTWTT